MHLILNHRAGQLRRGLLGRDILGRRMLGSPGAIKKQADPSSSECCLGEPLGQKFFFIEFWSPSLELSISFMGCFILGSPRLCEIFKVEDVV